MSGSVYIANFGKSNYKWPDCLANSTIATMIHRDGKPFYDAGNREGFIDWCVANRKTAAGLTPTRPVASRWYGAAETVEGTSGDIWLHREKDTIWWTESLLDAAAWGLEPAQDPVQEGAMVSVCQKPCKKWSNISKTGHRLDWNTIHPKAKHFLHTEGTMQKLSHQNAEYAIALINGDDLSIWENQAPWKKVADNARQNKGKVFNAWEKTLHDMIMRAKAADKYSNGQVVERTLKNKELSMSDEKLDAYIRQIKESQQGLCALSGIPMECVGEAENTDLIYSLDRIDSMKHYEIDNLQLVCRFINRWKSDSDNSKFSKLIELIRST